MTSRVHDVVRPQNPPFEGTSRTRVYLRGDGKLTAFDRATGAFAWSVPIGPTDRFTTIASGVVIGRSDRSRWALRLHREQDGRSESIDASAYSGGVTMVGCGDGLTALRRIGGSVLATLYRLDATAKDDELKLTEVWSHTIDSNSRLAYLDDASQSKLVIYDAGAVELLDLRTGQTTRSNPVASETAYGRSTTLLAIRDGSLLYIVPQASRTPSSYISYVATERVGNMIAAVSLETGQLLWRTSIKPYLLVLTGLQAPPMLSLVRAEEQTDRETGERVRQLRVRLLDKRTGELLFSETKLLGRNRVAGLSIEPDEPSMTFYADGYRLRIGPEQP